MADFAVQLNGTDNYFNFGNLHDMGSNLANGFYLKFRIDALVASKCMVGIQNATGNQKMEVYLNADRSLSVTQGFIGFRFLDVNSTQLLGGTYIDTLFNNGNPFGTSHPHTIEVIADFANSKVLIKVDGFPYSVNYTSQGHLTAFTNFNAPFLFGQGMYAMIDDIEIGTSKDNLYGKWLFNEGTGATLADSTGNGNAGQILGGSPLWFPGLEAAPTTFIDTLNLSTINITSMKTKDSLKSDKIYPLGLTANLNQSTDTLKRWFPQMAALGIKYIRTDWIMQDMQPSAGVFNYSRYDTMVNLAAIYGIEIIALMDLYGMPDWIHDINGHAHGSNYGPTPAQYATWAQAAAIHFEGKVNLWEAGNEPNLNFYNPAGYNDPVGQYVPQLKAFNTAVKTGNSKAKVISGGLAGGITDGGDKTGIPTFLAAMLNPAAGNAIGSYDYLGIHPYGMLPFSNPYATKDYLDSYTMLRLAKNIQIKYSDTAPIAATEWGLPTHNGGVFVTRAEHAAHTSKMLNDIIDPNGYAPFVALSCQYTWNDGNTGDTDPEHNFGIVDTQLVRKPAAKEYQRAKVLFENNYDRLPTLY